VTAAEDRKMDPCPTEGELLRIKRSHEGSLMAIEDVVGVGVGPCSSGGGLCLKVYASRLTPPLRDRVPATLEGARVEIEVIGDVSAF
jgi:hypothetical protein